MKFTKCFLEGLFVIDVETKDDLRGNFARIFCKDELKKQQIVFDIVQINRSLTKKKGTIRGMHFQKTPKSEDKIIQCLKGRVYDVALDLRPHSKTFGKWMALKLSEKNKKMFLIPKGFAHGFQTLTQNCELSYFMSEYYAPEYASGVRWDDPKFNIFWRIKNPTLSKEDKMWPLT